MPLAEKPHLLQPNVRKDELFGIPKSAENSSLMEIKANQLGLTSRNPGPPSYAPLLAKRPQASTSPLASDVILKIEEEMEVDQIIKNSSNLLKSKDCVGEVKLSHLIADKSDELKISIVDNTTAVLSKPPPLVKITPPPPEGSSSSSLTASSSITTTTTVLSIPKWGPGSQSAHGMVNIFYKCCVLLK